MIRFTVSKLYQVGEFAGPRLKEVFIPFRYQEFSSTSSTLYRGPVIVEPRVKHRNVAYTDDMDKSEEVRPKYKIMIGGIATQAMLLKQAEKYPEICETTTVVSTPSWLLKLHPDWFMQPWGQSMNYLPEVSRRIVKHFFSKFPENSLMNFEMMAKVEEEQRRQLRERGFHLIEDPVDRIEATSKGAIIHWGDMIERVGTDEDYEIVHTGRVPIGPEGIPVQHFGDAYSVSKKESNIPRIIVGSGLNAYWACRDFSNLGPIVHLIPPGDRVLPDLKGVLHAAVQLEESQIDPLPDKTVLIIGKDLFSGKKIEMRVEISQIYSAMGFRLARELVTGESDRVRYVDTAPNPDAIKTFVSAAGVSTKKAMDLRGTVVPDGNMALNYLKIQAALGYYDLRESNAVLLTTAWENAILKKAMKMGVTIEPEFFDAVEDRVKHGFEKFIPSESQVWRVIRNAYEKGVPNGEHLGVTKPVATDRAGKPIAWEDFKKMILAPTERVLEEAHIKDKAEEPGVRPTM
ncbi:hypothetical protein [Legionella nagasakiensis]|uniref:hypothetical protein n=1 Tax=Legionella nagasakiensis TaxID=535290 RepID=UPI001056302A|nr:hypothetical protein [Legionella nagasakiensis]